ncbi:hypothetical protein ACN38_g2845 [Penicillium nordicum]|uniref:Uncharacterized protein n=1 Tax=Penicillium nordicum TaxID=229535 RepID=A0A0M8P646_9EURO|nr:hypothetical protein ACN38_g2845 [Penicillium nordicum]
MTSPEYQSQKKKRTDGVSVGIQQGLRTGWQNENKEQTGMTVLIESTEDWGEKRREREAGSNTCVLLEPSKEADRYRYSPSIPRDFWDEFLIAQFLDPCSPLLIARFTTFHDVSNNSTLLLQDHVYYQRRQEMHKVGGRADTMVEANKVCSDLVGDRPGPSADLRL